MELLSHVQLFVTPWIIAYQAPLSMGFSWQDYWSGLPFPSSGYLPNQGIEPWSPALQTGALPSKPPGKPIDWVTNKQQELVSHSFRGWVVQDQGARRFSAWWELRSWFIDDAFSLCSHMAEAERRVWSLFNEDTNPIHEGFILMNQSFPRGSNFKYHHIGIRIQHMNFGETQTFCP